MHSVEIYGYADREICVGCDGGCSSAEGCGASGRRKTADLVAEFSNLASASGLGLDVAFYEADDANIARHEDVRKILSAADLTPAIVLDGKLLFLGGFDPEGLLEETRKRLEA